MTKQEVRDVLRGVYYDAEGNYPKLIMKPGPEDLKKIRFEVIPGPSSQASYLAAQSRKDDDQ